jgi:hypothetical protein
MLKIEHIGIAVKDLSVSIPLFESLLGKYCFFPKGRNQN